MEEAKNKENKQLEKTDEKDKDKEKAQQPSGKDKEKKEEQELVHFGLLLIHSNVIEPDVLICLSHCRFDNMVEQAKS